MVDGVRMVKGSQAIRVRSVEALNPTFDNFAGCHDALQ
jgi:hypothetical protein